MRSAYWTFLESTTFQMMYYQRYRDRVACIDTGVKIITAFVSCGSIAVWKVWGQYPAVWASLLALSQIAQVVYPYLPFSKHLSALEFFLPDMQELVRAVTNTWRKFNSDHASDPEYIDAINFYEEGLSQLESKYLGASSIPHFKGLIAATGIECKEYLQRNFYSKKQNKR